MVPDKSERRSFSRSPQSKCYGEAQTLQQYESYWRANVARPKGADKVSYHGVQPKEAIQEKMIYGRAIQLHLVSGGATPGRARTNAQAEINPPWQSKVVIITLYTQDISTALADVTNDLLKV